MLDGWLLTREEISNNTLLFVLIFYLRLDKFFNSSYTDQKIASVLLFSVFLEQNSEVYFSC